MFPITGEDFAVVHDMEEGLKDTTWKWFAFSWRNFLNFHLEVSGWNSRPVMYFGVAEMTRTVRLRLFHGWSLMG